MLIALLIAAAAVLPIEVVGFSPDDRYVAWIEHGVGEGSGHPWARLHVTDVSGNSEAVAPVEIVLDSGNDTDTEEGAVRMARAGAHAAFSKLRVSFWVAPRVIQHDEKGALTDHRGAPIGTLQIEKRVSKKEKARCDEPFRPLLLRLVMLFLDDDRPARLAEDSMLPQDRRCASSCELAALFAHGKAALAFTKCGVQGFEGPAAKYTAYAGRLPYGLDEPIQGADGR
jgi:hypothetical protein